ncbi:hypothetical protein F5884DRAFT_864412 [Xylogone sp. PMI_703]|nr:hypothetical protein F5884DRAFT_864412 [Xylogone sp. PMI_703]
MPRANVAGLTAGHDSPDGEDDVDDGMALYPIRLEEDESDSSSLSYNRSRSSSISSTFGPQDQSPISSRMSSSQSLPNSKDNSYTKKTALEENDCFALHWRRYFDEVGGAVGEGVTSDDDAKENHSRHSSDMNDTNDDAAQRRSSRPVEDQIPWPSQRHVRRHSDEEGDIEIDTDVEDERKLCPTKRKRQQEKVKPDGGDASDADSEDEKTKSRPANKPSI